MRSLSRQKSRREPVLFNPLACRASLVAAALLFVLLGASPTPAARADAVQGAWSAPGNGVIEIASCGPSLCGRIVGVERKPGEPMPTDVHGVSQCGLMIISTDRAAGDGSWFGKVTDPRNGRIYRAKLWVDGSGDLRLRGYLGVPQFGRTLKWRRFTGHLTTSCETT